MNIKASKKAKKQILKKKKKKRCNIYFRVTSFRIITCAFIPISYVYSSKRSQI